MSSDAPPKTAFLRQNWPGWLAYGLMIVVGVGGFFVVRAIGEGRVAAPVEHFVKPVVEAAAPAAKSVDVIFHVLATLAAMIGLGYVLGRVFRLIGQPPVIGEVVAGICLGPSLLGAIAPELMETFIPGATADPHGRVAASLQTIAQLGIVLYMFVVGLDLNGEELKHQAHAAVAISHASIIVPFLLGAMLSLWLHPMHAPAGVGFTSFSLFLGISMAITAFPVLARILTDRGMESSPIGMIALTCAAADDATAWCLLAFVVGIVQTQVGEAFYVAAAATAFIGGMLFVVRPLLQVWCRRLDRRVEEGLPAGALIIALLGVLLAALATETIGIHAIFGAFLLGAVMPHDSRLAQELKIRLRESVTVLLLPAFFAYTGMRTQIGLISGWENWLVCAAIILVATLGKFGGTLFAGRAAGLGWRDSAALGALMNTRGLMELIVLNIGLDLGVISPTLFAMMVLMALATTAATSPALEWLRPSGENEALRDAARERVRK